MLLNYYNSDFSFFSKLPKGRAFKIEELSDRVVSTVPKRYTLAQLESSLKLKDSNGQTLPIILKVHSTLKVTFFIYLLQVNAYHM